MSSANDLRQRAPLPPELRAKALELLRSKDRVGLRQIEKLMGWKGPIGMTNYVMAQQLGITERQLKYLLYRHDLREREKEKRIAESDAKNVAFAKHTSYKLGFSISLPTDWAVITDTLEVHNLEQEYFESLDRSKCAEPGFEDRKANAERHARLAQMRIGLFHAHLRNCKDEPHVEVTKLQLSGLLSALDLYELDKYLPEDVPWGSRPSKGMIVDGLSGVVYYFVMRTGDPTPELPVFFNVYLAEGDEGWIISCNCRHGDFFFKTFTRYKPIFRQITSTFRRLRTV